jgi:hypothetical protein
MLESLHLRRPHRSIDSVKHARLRTCRKPPAPNPSLRISSCSSSSDEFAAAAAVAAAAPARDARGGTVREGVRAGPAAAAAAPPALPPFFAAAAASASRRFSCGDGCRVVHKTQPVGARLCKNATVLSDASAQVGVDSCEWT